MKKVVAHYSKPMAMPKTRTITKPLSYLWALSGALIPALFIHGALANGSPALLIEQKHGRCAYLDILGGFYTKQYQEQCSWYAFRDLNIQTNFQNLIKEK